jgi:hypothetical protein
LQHLDSWYSGVIKQQTARLSSTASAIL